MTSPALPITAAALAALLPLSALAAAPPRQPGAAEIGRAIERLAVVGRVLYVAAHPDDENTRLLSWLVSDQLVRTAYLSLTRGEGGQNLIGPEQGALLGLIRTQELLAARRLDGAEQLFTRARDFGYSKSADETLRIWQRDEVLADVVWAIRRFKPDLIVTRFPPQGGDTHGHHTASAILALEAFTAAADPAYRPEQLQAVGVWQAQRIVWNKSLWGAKPGEDLSAFLALDLGAYNPALGASYGEIAAASRSMHKSQGFGAAATRGPSREYFKVLGGAPAPSGIFDGLDLGWGRVKGAERLAAALARATGEYNPRHPAASIPALLAAGLELDALPDNPWKADKQRELEELVAACAGLFLEATAGDEAAVAGGPLGITATAVNRAGAPIELVEVRLPGGVAIPVGKPLPANRPVELAQSITVPATAPPSNPYWLDQPPLAGLFPVNDRALIGLPEEPPPLSADFVLRAGARRFVLRRTIAYKWTDPVAGERYRRVEIVPRVMVNPAAPVRLFPDGKAQQLRLTVKAGPQAAAGQLRLQLPAGWRADPAAARFELGGPGAEQEVVFSVQPPAAPGSAAPPSLRAVAEVDGQPFDRGLVRIEHPHIPVQTLFPLAEVKLVRFELARRLQRIGYIPGPGDEVAAALRQAGYEVTLLDDETLRERPLRQFQAIVVGVRAYNANPRLPSYRAKLMDYVAGGGTLLVQYHTNSRIAKLKAELGPLPFEVTQERVTDENAAVELNPPSHSVFQRPNRIGEADFAGWVQERGLYFAGPRDPKFETPLRMHDPGEPPRDGALILARHGKGAFLYTGLAFFRQLPAGVPGAFRLFANLLEYGR